MTTPERLKRRQQLELRGLILLGLMLVVLGVAQLGTYAHFQRLDQSQRACIAENLGGLGNAARARGEISTREAKAARLESKATRLESKALNREFLPRAFSAKSQAEVFDAYGAYRAELTKVNEMRAKVDARRDRIKQDRAAHPIPAFPPGRCE